MILSPLYKARFCVSKRDWSGSILHFQLSWILKAFLGVDAFAPKVTRIGIVFISVYGGVWVKWANQGGNAACLSQHSYGDTQTLSSQGAGAEPYLITGFREVTNLRILLIRTQLHLLVLSGFGACHLDSKFHPNPPWLGYWGILKIEYFGFSCWQKINF